MLRPHILVLIAHDLGRHLGCYGRGVTTPAIDRLANQGALLERAFAAAPQCSPSRAALNSGLWPHRTGMLGLAHLGWSMRPEVPKLPELLAAAGYRTALVGLEHEGVGCMSDHGYQEIVEAGSNRAEEVAARAVEFIRDSVHPQGRRAFASIGFEECHRPFPESRGGVPRLRPPPAHLPDLPEVRRDLAGLDESARRLDAGVGRVLAELDRRNLDAETLVVFTTDHGIAFPRAKGTLLESGLETALIMRLPGVVRAGLTSDALVGNVDVLPTLCELAGAAVPAGIDGRGFLPVARGQARGHRERLFAEMTWHDAYAPQRAVRTGRHKLIRRFGPEGPAYVPLDVYASPSGRAVRSQRGPDPNSAPREELYDLAADPAETENLAADPAHASLVEGLRTEMERWMAQSGDPLLVGPVPGRESPEWAQLRASQSGDL
ncbi:MAG: sulfatase [Candidatus Dormibacteraeota bacterium]|nr:sulfatase [Candidatus Dormibacteraeota bacterium]